MVGGFTPARTSIVIAPSQATKVNGRTFIVFVPSRATKGNDRTSIVFALLHFRRAGESRGFFAACGIVASDEELICWAGLFDQVEAIILELLFRERHSLFCVHVGGYEAIKGVVVLVGSDMVGGNFADLVAIFVVAVVPDLSIGKVFGKGLAFGIVVDERFLAIFIGFGDTGAELLIVVILRGSDGFALMIKDRGVGDFGDAI